MKTSFIKNGMTMAVIMSAALGAGTVQAAGNTVARETQPLMKVMAVSKAVPAKATKRPAQNVAAKPSASAEPYVSNDWPTF